GFCRTVLSVQIGKVHATATTVTPSQPANEPKVRQVFRSWRRGKLGNHVTVTAFPLFTDSHSRWHSTSASPASLPRSRSGALPGCTPSPGAGIPSGTGAGGSPPPASAGCVLLPWGGRGVSGVLPES